MRRLVIYNPTARASRPRRVQQWITSALTEAGLAYQLEVSEDPQAASELARQAAVQGFDQVIAAGGDGTVNAVINGIAASASALGIIPLGTANALAKNIGLGDGDIGAAVQVIAQARIRRIDLGMMNGRYFGTMAGVGLDAQVASEVNDHWKRRLGSLAFVTQFLTTATRYQPCDFDLQLDGEPSLDIVEPLWAIVICNFPLYTWRLTFVPQARADDGQLDVIIFHHCRLHHLLGPVARSFLWGNGLGKSRYITLTRARRIQISSQPVCWWQADGDIGGQTPVVVEVAAEALSLIVPPSD